jgi:hypothetical protein
MADNLVLGRGKLFFAPYAFNQTTGGVKGYFGNTPMLSLAQTNTKLDHYSSEAGLKVKDKSIILQSDMTLTFDTDNVNVGNLILWFGGSNAGALPSDAPAGLGAMAFLARSAAIYGAIFFESDNPVGENANYWFPYVNLTPNGNFALKGDTWQQMSFTGECLKRDALTERMYSFDPAGGVSTAATDTTPQFTPTSASVPTSSVATAGTVTSTTPHTVAVPWSVAYTLTGGTVAWAWLHDGTTTVGDPVLVSGAAGTSAVLTAPIAGTYTVKLYDTVDASTTALATSASVTVT